MLPSHVTPTPSLRTEAAQHWVPWPGRQFCGSTAHWHSRFPRAVFCILGTQMRYYEETRGRDGINTWSPGGLINLPDDVRPDYGITNTQSTSCSVGSMYSNVAARDIGHTPDEPHVKTTNRPTHAQPILQK